MTICHYLVHSRLASAYIDQDTCRHVGWHIDLADLEAKAKSTWRRGSREEVWQEGIEGLQRSLEAQLIGAHADLGCCLRHERPHDIIDQQVSPDFLAHDVGGVTT